MPSSVFGSNAPSNRVVMGCVGLGGMGMGNMRGFPNKKDVQIVAVCDVVTSGRTEYGPNANGYGNKGKDLGRPAPKPTLSRVGFTSTRRPACLRSVLVRGSADR